MTDIDTLQQVKDGLLSGRYFVNHANSAASRGGYHPCIRRDMWARYIKTLGRMAELSDPLAQIAATVVTRLNLYGTAAQLQEAAPRAIAEAIAKGWDDVIGRTGPSAGRPSSYQRPYTLAEIVIVAHWLAACETAEITGALPGVGWAVLEITKELGIPSHRLPLL